MLRWKNKKKNAPLPKSKDVAKRMSGLRTNRQVEKLSVSPEQPVTDEPLPNSPPPKSPKTVGVTLPGFPNRESKLATLVLESSHPNVALPSSDAPHAERVMLTVTEMWREKLLNDVVLAVGPHRVGTHKLILAACSGYFSELFTAEDGSGEEEFVYRLHGISVETLRLLLESMYTGKLQLEISRLEEILSASAYLKLSFALKLCCEFMIENMKTSTCLRTLALANMFGLDRVTEEASKMAARNFSKIVDTEEFLELPHKSLSIIISRDDLIVHSELNVFDAFLRWVAVDHGTRLEHAVSLLQNVRLPMIKPSDLVDHVESVGYLMELPLCEALVKEALHYYCLPLRQGILQSKRTTPRSTTRLTTVVALGGQPRRAKDLVGSVINYYNSNTKEWRELASMTHPLHHHAGFLYVAGGKRLVNSPDGPLRTAHRYDPRTDSWIQIADMLTARESFQMGVLPDGMIYAIGGRQSDDISLAAVERYDPATDMWEERAPLCSPRRCVAVAVHQGKLFAIGGSGNKKISNKVECYCPLSNTWVSKCELATPRFFAALSSVGDYLFLAGGATVTTSTSRDGASAAGVHCIPHVERYDPRDDVWTTMQGVMSQPRAEAASCVVGATIYVLGGYCWDKKTWLQSVECYDVEADDWTEAPEYPRAYTGLTCCSLTLYKLP